METDKKSLSSMPLTGLILTNDSLENIIENDELSTTLENYATKQYADEAAAKVSEQLTDYVPLSDYNILQQKLADLETLVAEMSAKTFDINTEDSVSALLQNIDGRIDGIDGQLNGFSLESVSESAFNPSQANDKTFYFVTPVEDTTIEDADPEEQG